MAKYRRRRRVGGVRRRRRRGFRSTIKLHRAIERKLAVKRRVTGLLTGTIGSKTDVSADSDTTITLQPTFQRGTGATAGDFTGSKLFLKCLRIRGEVQCGSTAAEDHFIRMVVIKHRVGDAPVWANDDVIEEKATTYPSVFDFRAWSPAEKHKIIMDKIIKVPCKDDVTKTRYRRFIKMKIMMNLWYTVDLAGTTQSGSVYKMYLISDVPAANTTARPQILLHGRYTYADMS